MCNIPLEEALLYKGFDNCEDMFEAEPGMEGLKKILKPDDEEFSSLELCNEVLKGVILVKAGEYYCEGGCDPEELTFKDYSNDALIIMCAYLINFKNKNADIKRFLEECNADGYFNGCYYGGKIYAESLKEYPLKGDPIPCSLEELEQYSVKDWFGGTSHFSKGNVFEILCRYKDKGFRNALLDIIEKKALACDDERNKLDADTIKELRFYANFDNPAKFICNNGIGTHKLQKELAEARDKIWQLEAEIRKFKGEGAVSNDEAIVEKLKDCFFSDAHDDIPTFLKAMKEAKKNPTRVEIVAKWMRDKKISKDRRSELYKILHEAGFYNTSKTNWNTYLSKYDLG